MELHIGDSVQVEMKEEHDPYQGPAEIIGVYDTYYQVQDPEGNVYSVYEDEIEPDGS